MKRWKTTQQMALYISEFDSSKAYRELNISQCNKIAKNVKNMYEQGGKPMVMRNIHDSLPSYSARNLTGLTMHQKNSALRIVEKMFGNYWWPWSRIRNNMKTLIK